MTRDEILNLADNIVMNVPTLAERVDAGMMLRQFAAMTQPEAPPTPEQPTLRDWLAMHASEEDIQEFIPQTVGEQERRFKQDGIRRTRTWARYQAADAMLAARKGAM